jgi:predicted RNase H-like HicB family nuclease
VDEPHGLEDTRHQHQILRSVIITIFPLNVVYLSLIFLSTNFLKNKRKARGCRMIFHVTLEQSEDGWIVVECPALPGCVSQGRDEKEALDNIKEAIIAWLWAEDQKALAALPAKPGQKPIVVAV